MVFTATAQPEKTKTQRIDALFCALNEKTHDLRGFCFVEVVWGVLLKTMLPPPKPVCYSLIVCFRPVYTLLNPFKSPSK